MSRATGDKIKEQAKLMEYLYFKVYTHFLLKTKRITGFEAIHAARRVCKELESA